MVCRYQITTGTGMSDERYLWPDTPVWYPNTLNFEFF